LAVNVAEDTVGGFVGHGVSLRPCEQLLDAIPSAIVLVDQNGSILHVNASAEACFEFGHGEGDGVDVRSLFACSSAGEGADFLDDYLAAQPCVTIAKPRHISARRRGGSVFPAEVTIGAAVEQEPRNFICTFRDLSEKVAVDARFGDLRDALLNDFRRSAVSDFAAALAHELNQPLAAASYFISAGEALLADTANFEQGVALLRMGSEQILRAGDVVRRLRALTAPPTPSLERVSLPEIVEAGTAMAMLGELEHEIKLVHNFDPHAEFVTIDRLQITQVVFVLMRNAISELKKKGRHERTISITTQSVTSDIVEMSIADTGSGLPPPVLALFGESSRSDIDPNVKALGLSLSRQIIAAHGGTFGAANHSTGGAIFRITLWRTQLDRWEASV